MLLQAYSLVAQRLSVCMQCRRRAFDPWVGKIPWRRKWQPTPVFLPGESHGQRSLAGYSPQGCKELDTTAQLHFTSLHCSLPVPYQLVQYVSRIWEASRWMKEAKGIIPRIMEILSSMVFFFFLNMSSLFICNIYLFGCARS